MFNCAIDLGASGGRVMLSEYSREKLTLTEIHRFPNEPVMKDKILCWDIPRLFHEIKTGLKKIAAEHIPLSGIGIDTWGVDYAFLDANGQMIGLPAHYRDSRTDGYANKTAVPLTEIYERTGIQLLSFNTLFQLMADAETRPELLDQARDLVFIPDLFTYLLTGAVINEYTIASTSQLLNAAQRDWDDRLIDALNLSGLRRLLKPLTPPGTVIGKLTGEIQAETGLPSAVQMVTAGSHDTASAVAGTPLRDSESAYLSCGTWSLLGMELDAPCLTEASYQANFTNEGGLDGKIRYLKNINGLWMIQRLLKSYNNDKPGPLRYGFPDLIREAENVADKPDKKFRVAPNDPSFTNPPNMAAAVCDYCARTGQGVPQGIGETAMAVYNGLTDEYAATLREMETLQGSAVHTLHMVGGGVRDALLCRMTAKATGKRVEAGPVEASALGNVAAQLLGLGAVSSLQDARDIIRRSFEPNVYA